MNTSIRIFLDTRRKRKDNTYPIRILVIHNRKNFSISPGYAVEESQWDAAQCTIKKTCKNIPDISYANNKLQKEKSKAFDIINKLKDSGEIKCLTMKDSKESTF